MKKILSYLLMSTMAISAMAKTYYCDPASTRTTGQAGSWEAAISPAALRQNITGVRDTVYIKGGTILITQLSEIFEITKSLTFIGGFDPSATGKVTQLPTYPSATPTIFSGDKNQNGKPDQGDAQALIRVDFSSDSSLVFRLIGCDLINTYYDGEVDSPNDVLTSTAYCAALRILRGTAYVRNCRFYNHVTPNGRGSQCVTSVGARLHMTDCELRDGISMTRGGLLRLRQYFVGGDANKPIDPDCVLERCALYNGNNMGGDACNSAGFYGGAIQVSYGPFFAINTTIANSHGYSDGGGLNGNKSGVSLISCTIANNESARGTDPTSTAKGTYGSNFHIADNGKLRIANTMILGPNDDGSKLYTVLYSDPNTLGLDSTCISGGYNITGTYFYYANGHEVKDQTSIWLASDKYTKIGGEVVQNMADYLGTDPQMEDNGGCTKTMKPLDMQNGDNVAHLQELADQWCPKWTKVNASVDQRGYIRDVNTTCVGAMAIEAEKPSGLENVNANVNANRKMIINGQIVIEKNGQYYNLLGTQL